MGHEQQRVIVKVKFPGAFFFWEVVLVKLVFWKLEDRLVQFIIESSNFPGALGILISQKVWSD